ncbi:hypothetical protein BFR38_03535 [Brochothrix thermosphacta]|uniref:HAMP domain-containing sensor histidine kinase n=1 Tax=Brochothrix thermosphacta TaxID=2756 RepID=UPI00083FD795|nr:HAMP domain-containing histidine kinase [Brochothrix thermosphacta]ODJ52068.1 hypothetical protein BFR38_03535 [Brochothrix thermosphacta]ODJ60781.1 hypothetical protein BFR42_02365 [Brochothrix thermosphacta]
MRIHQVLNMKNRSLKYKWMLGTSVAIFLTFSVFAVAIYQGVSTMLLNEEKSKVQTALNNVTFSLAGKSWHQVNATDFPIDSESLNENIYNRGLIVRILKPDGSTWYPAQYGGEQQYNIPLEKVEAITVKETVNKGSRVIVGIKPVLENNAKIVGYVQVINPLTSVNSLMKYLFWTLLILDIIALVFSAILGYVMALHLLQPIKDLARSMVNSQENGFKARVKNIDAEDEISELLTIYNDMMRRMEVTFEQQKHFVEDASHELRTPVQIIEGHLNLLNRWGKDDPEVLEESLKASLFEVNRMKKLVQEMLDLSRAEQVSNTAELQITNLNEAVEQVKRNFEILHDDFNITYDYNPDIVLRSLILRNHLEQILIILFDNAVKYSNGLSEINITLEQIGNRAVIKVKDHGVGIDPSELDKVFNRFYRVDKARTREVGGNGLGLAIAKQLVVSYKGTISADSVVGEGTTVSVSLPIMEEEIIQTARKKPLKKNKL